MKKILNSLAADLYLNAAIKLKLNFEIINQDCLLYRIFNQDKELLFKNGALSLNSQVAVRIAKNKNETSMILASHNIPTPKFKIFRNKKLALEYALNNLHQKVKMVIKPTNGKSAHGVYINPKTDKQVNFAIDEALAQNKQIMIEDYIKGRNYRITIFHGEIIAVTWRRPGFIIGDGENDISHLIRIKNFERKKVAYPQIDLRPRDISYLKSKNMLLETIPQKGQMVKLQLGCDMEIGGDRKFIKINSIPMVNKSLFIKIYKYSYHKLLGIDFIIPDIAKPFNEQDCAVNEINSAPDMAVHYFDQIPANNYAAERILDLYFFGKTEAKNSKFSNIINYNFFYNKESH